MVWDTEVWSWGKGRKGQLGHGDMLDRSVSEQTGCCLALLLLLLRIILWNGQASHMDGNVVKKSDFSVFSPEIDLQ